MSSIAPARHNGHHERQQKGRCRVSRPREYAPPTSTIPRLLIPWRHPRIPRGTSALNAAIHLLELHDRDLGRGDVARALDQWRRITNRPRLDPLGYGFDNECGIWGCCPPSREVLELAMRRLPARPGRELRRLVAPLDDEFLKRTYPDPTAPPGPWWRRRC
jgi:hypothetical protein